MEREKLHRVLILVSCLVVFIVLGATVGLWHTPDDDEIKYHLPVIKQYLEQFPLFDLRGYNSASGPVTYILLSGWAYLFGTDITVLRLAVLLFGIGVISVLWRILFEEKLSAAVLITLFVFLCPYFLFRAFSLYPMVPSLFLGLLSLLAFEKYLVDQSKRSILAGYILCSTAAVLSRQLYLSYAVGIAAFALSSRFRSGRNAAPAQFGPSYGSIGLMLIPVLALGLLFFHWRGTTPPKFVSHASSGVNLNQVNFIFIFLGFWFWPIFVDNMKAIPKWVYLAAALVAVHLVWTPLYLMDEARAASGIIARLYGELTSRGLPLTLLKGSQIILWFIGVMVLVILARSRSSPYVFIVFAHFGILLFVAYVWEKYYLPLFPVIWLATRKNIHNPRLYVPLVLQQAGVTALYFITHL